MYFPDFLKEKKHTKKYHINKARDWIAHSAGNMTIAALARTIRTQVYEQRNTWLKFLWKTSNQRDSKDI